MNKTFRTPHEIKTALTPMERALEMMPRKISVKPEPAFKPNCHLLMAREAKRLLDATHAALERDDKDEEGDKAEAAFYASCEPHYAGDDENLTAEELN